ADDAWEDEDEPEETEAVQSGDSALCFDAVHRPEPWPDVCTEAQQPSEVAKNEMYLEESFGRHVMISLPRICRRGLCCSIDGNRTRNCMWPRGRNLYAAVVEI